MEGGREEDVDENEAAPSRLQRPMDRLALAALGPAFGTASDLSDHQLSAKTMLTTIADTACT